MLIKTNYNGFAYNINKFNIAYMFFTVISSQFFVISAVLSKGITSIFVKYPVKFQLGYW